MLNGNQMGGKRRSAYHYDLWSLKYLPKFKWDHLTEEIGKVCEANLMQQCCTQIWPYVMVLMVAAFHVQTLLHSLRLHAASLLYSVLCVFGVDRLLMYQC